MINIMVMTPSELAMNVSCVSVIMVCSLYRGSKMSKTIKLPARRAQFDLRKKGVSLGQQRKAARNRKRRAKDVKMAFLALSAFQSLIGHCVSGIQSFRWLKKRVVNCHPFYLSTFLFIISSRGQILWFPIACPVFQIKLIITGPNFIELQQLHRQLPAN